VDCQASGAGELTHGAQGSRRKRIAMHRCPLHVVDPVPPSSTRSGLDDAALGALAKIVHGIDVTHADSVA